MSADIFTLPVVGSAPIVTEVPVEPVLPAEDENPYVIFVVGEVSSGKSAIVNSMAGGLISNSSLQRETLNLLGIDIVPGSREDNITSISAELESVHRSNNHMRNNLLDIKLDDLKKVVNLKCAIPSRYNIGRVLLVDFPGINDCGDTQEVFLDSFKSNIANAHLVLYVTDSSKAFLTSSETKNFAKIKRIVDEQNSNGSYVDMIILANKYDDVDEESYKEVFDRIPAKSKVSKDKILKYSAHFSLLKTLVDHKLFMHVPRTINDYLLKEVRKIMKSSDVRLDKRGEEILIRDCLLAFDCLKFSREPSADNTQVLFDYIAESREQNMKRQMTSHFENLDKNLNEFIQCVNYQDACKCWKRMNLDGFLFNRQSKVFLNERLLNAIDSFAIKTAKDKSQRTRLFPLEILFGFATRNKYHALSAKMIKLLEQNMKHFHPLTPVTMFKDYIIEQERVEYDWINWFSYVFSRKELYDDFADDDVSSYDFYSHSKNSWCNVRYETDKMHPALYLMLESLYTPLVVKKCAYLTEMSIGDISFMDHIGVLMENIDELEKPTDGGISRNIYIRIISNIKYCTAKCDSDSWSGRLFKEYYNKSHKKLIEKISNGFSGQHNVENKFETNYQAKYIVFKENPPKKTNQVPKKVAKKKYESEDTESSEHTVDTSSFEHKKTGTTGRRYHLNAKEESDTSEEEEKPHANAESAAFQSWARSEYDIKNIFTLNSSSLNELKQAWKISNSAKIWRRNNGFSYMDRNGSNNNTQQTYGNKFPIKAVPRPVVEEKPTPKPVEKNKKKYRVPTKRTKGKKNYSESDEDSDSY